MVGMTISHSKLLSKFGQACMGEASMLFNRLGICGV
jgi:hypothetical protein